MLARASFPRRFCGYESNPTYLDTSSYLAYQYTMVQIFLLIYTHNSQYIWFKCLVVPIPKKGKAIECSNYRTIALISHASKVMLKILQARLQQYVNHALPDVQADWNQRSNCQHPLDH